MAPVIVSTEYEIIVVLLPPPAALIKGIIKVR